MERRERVPESLLARPDTTGELASMLRFYGAEDRFLALSPETQLGYVDWIDRADDDSHRERRMRMIVAVIARSTTKPVVKLDD
jgi:hypothetical protein